MRSANKSQVDGKDKRAKAEPRYDKRNKFNDLSNIEWLISTKSVWKGDPVDPEISRLMSELNENVVSKYGLDAVTELLEQPISSVEYSQAPARDALKEQHPATYPERDIEKLLKFFTKKGEMVLDPFVGVGSTLVACMNTERQGVGVELISKWAELAKKRIEHAKKNSPSYQSGMESFTGPGQSEELKPPEIKVLEGDSREVLKGFPDSSFDFVVTSPPYWAILQKDKDHKARRERISKGLDTRYSEDKKDLGNIASYDEFLNQLTGIFLECKRVLKQGKYMCVVVSDFRHKSRFISYHSDLATKLESIGFSLEGITVLVQDSKALYPYGMPYAFVSNIHHQNILIFRKNGLPDKGQTASGV